MVEETSDEQSKQPLPRRSVLERIKPLGARGYMFTSTQKNDGLSSRSSVFQRIQRDGLPNQEHSSVSSVYQNHKMIRLTQAFVLQDITTYGEGPKRLRKETDDINEIRSIVHSRMMRKTHWEIQTEGKLKIRRRTIIHTKSAPQATLDDDDDDDDK
ncbi:hypothetical protein ACH5RR_026094 [Cinchona calisaya]|uniref:Uncharacterized protein n=1 Tax=Cinchona calisaya TaxID=153742 RepID=A0ABD2Z5J2_9GENT